METYCYQVKSAGLPLVAEWEACAQTNAGLQAHAG